MGTDRLRNGPGRWGQVSSTAKVRCFRLGPGFAIVGGALVALYVVLAELLELHPLGPRTPGDWGSMVSERGVECLYLWSLCVGACALLQLGRRRMPTPDSPYWPVAAVPSFVGAAWAVEFVATGLVPAIRGMRSGQPAESVLFPAAVHLALAVSPIVLCALSCWLLYRWKRASRPDHCRTCGYDLTGNVSGICPECGTPVPTSDGSDPKRAPQGSATHRTGRRRWRTTSTGT
jgi:hypothetical protein